jgi:hypothetical protein
MKYKLGKTPARPNAVGLKFGMFFNAEKLPTPPAKGFGHYGLGIGLNWGMLANDKYSNCVFAGADHEHMVWTHRSGAGQPVAFNNETVLADYAAVTGFDPAKPNTDQGTDMVDAADYRRKVGVIDASGARHKIDSYVSLRAGDANQLALATYLMGATAIGLRFPESAEKQFDNSEPWDYVIGSPLCGGHYVPCVGKNSDGNFLIVTWGRLQAMTPAFLKNYCDEALAYVSLDPLKNDLSPEGFNADQLRRDLTAITN